MSNFVIDKKKNRVYIPIAFEGVYDFGSIECSIGTIIEELEKEFPAINYVETGYATKRIRDKSAGKNITKTLWGFKENGFTIQAIHIFLSGRDKIELTMQEVEEFRIMYGLSIKHTPLNLCDVNEGLQVKNATSILDIVFHLLYYYTLNNLKLVKCEHCGRWFVTSNFKNKYCTRNSTVAGYTHLNCEQAVRNIKYQCGRKKNRIETKANNANKSDILNHSYSEFVLNFQKQCDFFIDKISQRHTVENLSEYMCFLDKVEKGKEWLNYGNSK
ncbi:MAG: hypothetical protein E7555_09420 [Ruminococcaceae bacterium]|nr:hypothetical protein [Oscillospiraceae bacterium]